MKKKRHCIKERMSETAHCSVYTIVSIVLRTFQVCLADCPVLFSYNLNLRQRLGEYLVVPGNLEHLKRVGDCRLLCEEQ